MTKHDSLVTIDPVCPLAEIAHLFPEGFPVRDPFAMGSTKDENGKKIALWYIDVDRLSDEQLEAIANYYAEAITRRGEFTTPAEVIEQAKESKVLGISEDWIIRLQGGLECIARLKEWTEFLNNTETITIDSLQGFINDQIARWIEGDEIPPPINSINDIPEELRSPELEQALLEQRFSDKLHGKNYLDILFTGIEERDEAIKELGLDRNREYSIKLSGEAVPFTYFVRTDLDSADADFDDSDWYEDY